MSIAYSNKTEYRLYTQRDRPEIACLFFLISHNPRRRGALGARRGRWSQSSRLSSDKNSPTPAASGSSRHGDRATRPAQGRTPAQEPVECYGSNKRKSASVSQRLLISWQGKKASNPRPTVLETVALPTELFPYKDDGGPSGTRTPDRPVMSRLL